MHNIIIFCELCKFQFNIKNVDICKVWYFNKFANEKLTLQNSIEKVKNFKVKEFRKYFKIKTSNFYSYLRRRDNDEQKNKSKTLYIEVNKRL